MGSHYTVTGRHKHRPYFFEFLSCNNAHNPTNYKLITNLRLTNHGRKLHESRWCSPILHGPFNQRAERDNTEQNATKQERDITERNKEITNLVELPVNKIWTRNIHSLSGDKNLINAY